VSGYPHISGPGPAELPALAALLEQLQQRHNHALECILLYGSCLRNGDIFDGLLDLYLICEDYSSAYNKGALAAFNWLLPPNLFYAQIDHEGQILRSKVTVISRHDFRRGCSRQWFQSYIWGRFAQPTRIIYSRNEEVQSDVEASLLQAVQTLLNCTLPSLPEQGSLKDLWSGALNLSYATELRSERNHRAAELADAFQEFYADVTRQQADSLAFPLTVYDENNELHYRSRIPADRRRSAGIAWSARRAQGKLLSVLRLIKALFTFESGLDYIAWKLQRHTGQNIAIPDKVRRYPLIFMWGFFWTLYRRGLFK